MTHTPSFLHDTELFEAPHPDRRRRLWRIFFLALGIGLAIWVLVLVFVTVQTVQAVAEAEGALTRAAELSAAMQFEEAHREVRRAASWVARVERGVTVLNSARALPWIGTQTQAAESMVQASSGILQAFDRLLTIGGDLLRLSGVSEEVLREMASGLTPVLTFDDLPSETKRALLQRLAASSDDFAATAADIRLAREELADIPRHSLFEPIRAVLQPVEERLAISEDALALASVAAHLLPAFAGLDTEHTTLLLFLNNDELRPGGGFIGTYGILRMQDGDIAALKTQDVYRLDQAAASGLSTTPPNALRTYGSILTWFFRDSNWSPDFAASSRQGLELFRREARLVPEAAQGEIPVAESISGVIGFTPTFASALLAITGPLMAGGQTFTAENIADKLEYQVEIGYVGQGIPPAQRKEILAELVEEMKSRLYRLPAREWPRLFRAVKAALTGKHLVFYSEDPEAQRVIEQAFWGGRILPKKGSDIQLIVDANLASLKSDPAVSRDIRYEVWQNTDGAYVGRTTIRYQHRGAFSWRTTRYRTYVRLYVPRGSTLVRASGHLRNDKLRNASLLPGTVDVGEELGLTTFGAFTSVEPGETRELIFEYLLSLEVAREIQGGSYQLQVFKQIGARPYGLTLDLDFDKNVSQASPPEEATEWGDDHYRLNTKLDQDLPFVVTL